MLLEAYRRGLFPLEMMRTFFWCSATLVANGLLVSPINSLPHLQGILYTQLLYFVMSKINLVQVSKLLKVLNLYATVKLCLFRTLPIFSGVSSVELNLFDHSIGITIHFQNLGYMIDFCSSRCLLVQMILALLNKLSATVFFVLW